MLNAPPGSVRNGRPAEESGAAASTRPCKTEERRRLGAAAGKRTRDYVGGPFECLIGVEPGGVDDDRIRRRRQRSDPTRPVARVPFLHVLQDILVYSCRAALPQLPEAALGARLGRSVTFRSDYGQRLCKCHVDRQGCRVKDDRIICRSKGRHVTRGILVVPASEVAVDDLIRSPHALG
jgi:hypothetical protein